ncbi:MAG: hypothetical protein KatS3mg105_1307 [Gemmatales bacterium]|nr:MAG: hypothetical protein KatS3mg105_1307 [Gemmatales bacterium]
MFLIRVLPALAATVALAAIHAEETQQLPVVFTDDFEKGATQWEPTDAKAWKLVKSEKNSYYRLAGRSNYKPPFRSPTSISLVKDVVVGDFIMDVQVQSTGKDVPHRDLCFFFGHQGPDQFYYVHIAKRADDHANQIFIVNKAPRVKISQESTKGTPWDDGWHHVRIVRKVSDGSIAVYFDDMTRPIMRAKDKTFTWGRVGVGSFDDTGNFDDFKLRGIRIKK